MQARAFASFLIFASAMKVSSFFPTCTYAGSCVTAGFCGRVRSTSEMPVLFKRSGLAFCHDSRAFFVSKGMVVPFQLFEDRVFLIAPRTSSVKSETAAARCSDTQDFAVPGTPKGAV